MAGIIRYFDLELKRLKVDLRLKNRANREAIEQEKPNVVIIATGGRANILPNWGYEDNLCVSSWDVLAEKVEINEDDNVLVFDEFGGHAGSLTANFVASKTNFVEIVTPEPFVAADTGGTTFPIMYRELYGKNVIQTPNFILNKVYKEGKQMIAQITNEYTHQKEEREVDLVVVENGTLPNDELYWQLQKKSLNQGEVDLDCLYDFAPQPSFALMDKNPNDYLLFRIGEAVCPRNIHGSIYDAIRLCKDI